MDIVTCKDLFFSNMKRIVKWNKKICIKKAQKFKENEQHFNVQKEINHGRIAQQNL